MKKIFAMVALLTVFMGAKSERIHDFTSNGPKGFSSNSYEWKELLTNGDAETPWGDLSGVAWNDSENNYKICAWGKVKQSNPFPATIEADGTGNHVFVVHAADCVDPTDGASAWDNQFWIESPQQFSTGTQLQVSFRYKASRECTTNTQVHTQNPSEYLHWEGIGDVTFTTEWQYFEKTVTINNNQDGAWSFAFNLNPYVKTATDFYFDDLSIKIRKKVKLDISPNTSEVVVHGKERDYLSADGNGNPREDQIGTGEVWHNQFFIYANRALKAGETTVISFDYSSSLNAKTSTECHREPGSYMHWVCLGDIKFKTEEQHLEKTFVVPSEADGMQCIAFDMAHIKDACDYSLKNFIWIMEDSTETLIDFEGTENFYVREGAGGDFLLYGTTETVESGIIISEIMQSNIDCIMDDKNEFPDSWVELYNAGNSIEDLSNYKIGLTDDPSKAWKLSSRIRAKEYQIIYCDKVAENNHTDFRLESGKGGAIYLFKNDEVVDYYKDIPKQLAPNVSYGRKNIDSDELELGFQYKPTPLKPNCGTLCSKLLRQPVFSHPGFVSENAQNVDLILSLPEDAPDNAEIRFTTDGSEPTLESKRYSEPIIINKTTIIRAKTFCEGYISDRSKSESYIIHNREVTLPVVSITTDDDYFYDPDMGIYHTSNNSFDNKNDWRRPINIEYFVPSEQESVINQLCETRVTGAASRNNDLKSLAVYANKRFGKKRLKYEFFPTQRPGKTDFKSIMLRNAGNDHDGLYMRDAIIQRSVAEHVDMDWQAWQPAIFYLNGNYMGILNVRERSNEDNIYTNYRDKNDEGLEDIDLFENGELKEGAGSAYNEFKEFYNSTEHTYAEYESLMDINEFQNYYVMELFYNNRDWLTNNYVQWKPRKEGDNWSMKWRWIAKDTDFGLGYSGGADYNTIEWFYTPGYDPDCNWVNTKDATRLFRRLMDIEQFKWEFLDKVAVYTGDFISSDSVKALIDEMTSIIKYEYEYHCKVNKYVNFDNKIKEAKDWIEQRGKYFFEQLANHYGLGSVLTGKINNELNPDDYNSLQLTINEIPLSGGTFNGRFFNGRELTVKSTCTDQTKKIKGWTVVAKSNGKETTTTYDSAEFSYTPDNLVDVTFNAILSDVTYTLKYVVDGAEYKSIKYKVGEKITPEATPTKEGYTFSGWSEIPETMPAHDVEVTGTFTKGAYKVTYYIDGAKYKEVSYDFGDAITPEAEPSKEGYTFSGWSDIPETMPAHDVEVYGSYSLNSYMLTYKVDKAVYKKYTMYYGATITPEAEPTKEGFTFSGWSEIPETMPAHDVDVTGSFEVNIYKVSYYVDESLVHEDEVAFGETFELWVYDPQDGDLTFNGWIGEMYSTMPAHDISYKADITSGIANIYSSSENIEGIYTLDGKKVEKIHQGVYVIRMKDGTTRKFISK